METDPNVPLAVEGMDARAYGDYVTVRQFSIASLTCRDGDRNFSAKKLLLEQAVRAEKDAADVLRSVALLTVTEGAEGDNLTVASREALLIRLRQNLFAARKHLGYTESKITIACYIFYSYTFLFLAIVTEGFETATEVFVYGGGGGANDLLSPDQRKALEAARKRKRDAAATVRRPAPYLPMAMAGGKRFVKKDRSNNPCHACG